MFSCLQWFFGFYNDFNDVMWPPSRIYRAKVPNSNNFWCIKILNLRVKLTVFFIFFNQKITELINRNGILIGKKTANYWPFMKLNIIGLSALNLKIVGFKWRNNAWRLFLSVLKRLKITGIYNCRIVSRDGKRCSFVTEPYENLNFDVLPIIKGIAKQVSNYKSSRWD